MINLLQGRAGSRPGEALGVARASGEWLCGVTGPAGWGAGAGWWATGGVCTSVAFLLWRWRTTNMRMHRLRTTSGMGVPEK